MVSLCSVLSHPSKDTEISIRHNNCFCSKTIQSDVFICKHFTAVKYHYQTVTETTKLSQSLHTIHRLSWFLNFEYFHLHFHLHVQSTVKRHMLLIVVHVLVHQLSYVYIFLLLCRRQALHHFRLDVSVVNLLSSDGHHPLVRLFLFRVVHVFFVSL